MRRGGNVPPLVPIYSDPYRVQHAGPKVFVLEVGPNLEKVTVECLKVKPHTGPLPVVPAVLAKWGRPRKEKKRLFIILFLLFILVEASSWGGPCRGQ